MTDDKTHTTVIQPSGGVVSVASDTIGALRGTPILLVMVLLNCAFICGAAFYLRIQQDNVYKLVDKMLDRCLNSKTSYTDNYVPYPPARPYSATPDKALPKDGDG
jgi:hypothetical protein